VSTATALAPTDPDASAPAGVADPEAAQAVLRVITTRRSAPAFLPLEPDRETIETLLTAANTAPNHKLTQPWRFFVLRGDARLEFASAVAGDMIADQTGRAAPADGWADQCRTQTAQAMLRAPVVIAVAVVPQGVPGLPDWEELAASAAGVQNLLLAAHGLGLGAAWKSKACPLPGALEWLGLSSPAQLVGHVLLGYADPSVEPKPKLRRSHRELTTWLGWDE
jgi:nitroreductase